MKDITGKILTSNNYEIISADALTNVRFYTSEDPGSYVAPHWHDALEIILLQKGELFFTVEDQRIALLPGQCILVNPSVVHSTMCTKPNTAIVFQIPLGFYERFIPDIRNRKFILVDPAANSIEQTKVDLFKETIEKMQIMTDVAPEGGMLRFNSLLYEALFQLFHNFSILQKENIGSRDKRLEKLKPVLDHINLHYNEPISLEEIAGVAMLEPKYFCRVFKNVMGTTFLEYQNKVRLSKIYTDIIETDDAVSEILDRHGFSNYKKFRTMFREEFQATPTEIRKKRRKK